jgi:hypothetical protein
MLPLCLIKYFKWDSHVEHTHSQSLTAQLVGNGNLESLTECWVETYYSCKNCCMGRDKMKSLLTIYAGVCTY